MTDFLVLAREAAIEAHGKSAVGEFSHTLQEDQDQVLTYLFQSKLKGYPDWFIAVTIFVAGNDASVSEVVLTPGDTSLLAPKWVPWSERLADYKALQAALEAEAAAAAALAGDDEEGEGDSDESAEKPARGAKRPRRRSRRSSDSTSGNTEDVEEGADAAEGTDAAEAAATAEPAEESAVAIVPETPEAQDDADAAGGKAKSLFKWKTLRGGKKRK